MKTQYTGGSARLAATIIVTSAFLSGALLAFAPGVACAQQMEKKGTTPYVFPRLTRRATVLDELCSRQDSGDLAFIVGTSTLVEQFPSICA